MKVEKQHPKKQRYVTAPPFLLWSVLLINVFWMGIRLGEMMAS